jgi:hypothetical protein
VIFFGGLSIGLALVVLSWRSHNVAGVVQGLGQLILGVAAAVSLDAMGELLAIDLAWNLYAIGLVLGAGAWWTIRNAGRSRGDEPQVLAGHEPLAVTKEPGKPGTADPLPDAPATKALTVSHKAGRGKRIAAYSLVSLDLFGLALLVFVAIAMWSDRPRQASVNETLLGAVLTTGPWMVSLLLFGWIAEVRLCWLLGATTLVPFLALAIAGAANSWWPFALAALTGLVAAAFAVEVLRRLRKDHAS